jgi:hypothetical protein
MLRHNRSMLLAMVVLFSALLSAGAGQAWAYNGDQNGYYDRNGYNHHYGYYHHHHGYWNEQNGVRLWINVG